MDTRSFIYLGTHLGTHLGEKLLGPVLVLCLTWRDVQAAATLAHRPSQHGEEGSASCLPSVRVTVFLFSASCWPVWMTGIVEVFSGAYW